MADVTRLHYSGDYDTYAKVPQVAALLPILEADQFPLISKGFNSKLWKSVVRDWTFRHHEDALLPDTATATATQTSSGATITFTNDYTYFKYGDLWMNERTKEVVYVTTATASMDATVDVTRANGRAGAAVQIGDVFRRIGNAHQEVGTAVTPLLTKEAAHTFYQQYRRQSAEISKVSAGTEIYHKAKRGHNMLKILQQYKRELEFGVFWGCASTNVYSSGTYATYASAGLYDHITTNVKTIPTLTFGELYDLCDLARRYHTSGKFRLYAGPSVMQIINDLCWDKIRIEAGADVYGLDIRSLVLGTNRITLEEEPLWYTEYMGQNAFLIPEPFDWHIRKVAREGFGMKWDLDVKKDDNNNTIKDELTEICGFEFWEENKFARIDGITG